MTKSTLSKNSEIKIIYVPLSEIKPNDYNPKRLTADGAKALQESIEQFGQVDPLILNAARKRKNILIGGHQRYVIYKKMGMRTAPCVYLDIPDLEREKELCIRLSKNVGEFDWNLLANFKEDFLKDVGFASEELDEIFGLDDQPEAFDLAKELQKLQIGKIETKKGTMWQIGPHRIATTSSSSTSTSLTT
ncbi:MAG: ParB N-terminal domain-containing protein [Minisyncoccia bacterium]